MEIYLKSKSNNEITVSCDGQFSHVFALNELPSDPIELGTTLFNGLFHEGTIAYHAWISRPNRVLFVAENSEIDAIPWEYLYGPNGFIVLEVAFVRGLPYPQRQLAPDLNDVPLQIVAIPSNPIANNVARLDIYGEWERLKESLHILNTTITLERACPPTLEQTSRLIAGQRNRVLHFMGHGGHDGKESFLLFEDERGAPRKVTAQEIIRHTKGTTFLVSLNACDSAISGETEFSNIARLLTEHGVPYALGMRLPIPDEDAKAFSQTFYRELASGSSVENALLLARKVLTESQNSSVFGIPVLYTSLKVPVRGFQTAPGIARIEEHKPPLDISILPRTEGVFQGRVDELLVLGNFLTGEQRVQLITVHGSGGQGKTALVREAAERFAHAWPGGVWAISLEHKYSLEDFSIELARLLKIDLEGIYKLIAGSFPNLERDLFQQHFQRDLERRIIAFLNDKRTLLVFDNVETFIEAVDANNNAAVDLEAFLREQILSTQTTLLFTSRRHLNWLGEQVLELEGLAIEEGARLFWQCAPSRGKEAVGPQREEISRKVNGHPLSLRLLGSAFDASLISLESFVQQVDIALIEAEDKYKHENHRHRTLYASIETSIRYLEESQIMLLSSLWIFKAGFLSEVVCKVIGSPSLTSVEEYEKLTKARLYSLFQRGLLIQDTNLFSNEYNLIYRIHPVIHLFIKRRLGQSIPINSLQSSMGRVYRELLHNINESINSSSWASFVFVNCFVDLEECATLLDGKDERQYAYQLGRVLYRIGSRQAGLRWLERALELAQEVDPSLEANTLNNIALIYMANGQLIKALDVYYKLLPMVQAMNNASNEATILGNMGEIHRGLGQPAKALELFEQALPNLHEEENHNGISKVAVLNNLGSLYREIGDFNKAVEVTQLALRTTQMLNDLYGESVTLANLALIYSSMGKLNQALLFFEQTLALARKIGDRSGESACLGNLGDLFATKGQPAKAVEYYEQALLILSEVGNRIGEGIVLGNKGIVYSDLGQFDKALVLLKESLFIAQETGARINQTIALTNIGEIYKKQNQITTALEFYERALPIAREIPDKIQEANIINKTGLLYEAIGQYAKAFDMLENAKRIRRNIGNKAGEAQSLSDIAYLYKKTGKTKKAWNLLEQSLVIRREIMDARGEAVTLIGMGEFVFAQNQFIKSLEFFENALEVCEASGDLQIKSTVLNNIAFVKYELGELNKSLEIFQQSLSISRVLDDLYGETITVNNMALVYKAMGQPTKSLELFKRTLINTQKQGDRVREVMILVNLSELLYSDLSRAQDAIEYCERALGLWQELDLTNHSSGLTVSKLREVLRKMKTGQSLRETPWRRWLKTLASYINTLRKNT